MERIERPNELETFDVNQSAISFHGKGRLAPPFFASYRNIQRVTMQSPPADFSLEHKALASSRDPP